MIVYIFVVIIVIELLIIDILCYRIDMTLRITKSPRANRIILTIGGSVMSQNEQVVVGKSYLVNAQPVNPDGSNGQVFAGSYAWTLSDPTKAGFVPSADGTNGVLQVIAAGAFSLDVSANADTTGATTVPITGEADCTATAPVVQASSINLTFTAQ